MSKIERLRAGLFFVMLVLAPAALVAQEADTVYVNGTVYTVDDAFSKASAFAVKDGEFIYVGDDAGARSHAGPLTFVVDLEGKTVIPGLHDAHIHIRFGERELYPRIPDIRQSLGEWASVERMQEVVRNSLATGAGMRPGPEPRWLVLRGWMSDVWDPPVWRKELIDAVAPDNPVYIIRYTHGSAANSKALELAGITRDTPDPEGGHIKKDENGEPTGEFVERAPPQLLELIPPLPPMTNYELSRNLVEGTQLAAGQRTHHVARRQQRHELRRRSAGTETLRSRSAQGPDQSDGQRGRRETNGRTTELREQVLRAVRQDTSGRRTRFARRTFPRGVCRLPGFSRRTPVIGGPDDGRPRSTC